MEMLAVLDSDLCGSDVFLKHNPEKEIALYETPRRTCPEPMCRPYKASKSLLDLSLYLQGSAFPGYPEASKWSQSPSSLPNGSSQTMRKPGCKVSPTGQAEQGNSLLVSSTSVFQQHYVQLTTHQWHRFLVTLIKKIHNPNPTFNCCTERNQPPGPLIQAELSEARKEKKTRLRL